MRTGYVLAAAHLAGCVLFVLLREPVHPLYLAEVDKARQDGGMYLTSGIDGTIACRNLYSWSEWHGGEALGVKVLEVANLPVLVFSVFAGAAGDISGIGRGMSACNWSWVVAFLFVALSTGQWLLVGWLIEQAWSRLRRRAAGIGR
jgi:hypothetical protein